MAKPIEIRLVLEGDDARKFQTYMENPTITEKGRQLLAEAYEESRHFSLIYVCSPLRENLQLGGCIFYILWYLEH